MAQYVKTWRHPKTGNTATLPDEDRATDTINTQNSWQSWAMWFSRYASIQRRTDMLITVLCTPSRGIIYQYSGLIDIAWNTDANNASVCAVNTGSARGCREAQFLVLGRVVWSCGKSRAFLRSQLLRLRRYCWHGTQRQPAKLKPSYDPQQTWPPPRLGLLTLRKWRQNDVTRPACLRLKPSVG